jgi:molybdate transport system regulatory protein
LQNLTFGEGPCELLKLVEKTGSLHKAAMEMNMSYRKAWLLHGVSEPRVEAEAAGVFVGHGGTSYREANLVIFEDGRGRLRVHPLLPASGR